MSWNYTPLLEASALLGQVPPTVSLSSPADTATVTDTTPDLVFTGTDTESEDLRYQVQVDTVNTFDSQTAQVVGYNTVGASSLGPSQNKFFGTRFTTPSVTSQVASAKVAICSDIGTGRTAKMVIVRQSDLKIVTNGVSDAITVPYDSVNSIPDNFTTVTFSTYPTLEPNTDYILGIIHNDSDFSIYVGYDTGTANYYYFDSTNDYTTPTDPTDSVTTGDDNGAPNNAKMSIYVTLKTPLIGAVSGTDAGFSGSPDNTDPFASGQAVTYTVQSALSDTTTYYWRVRGIDPSGSNSYGAWATTRSFYVDTGGGTSYTPTYTETMILVDTLPRSVSRTLTDVKTLVDTLVKGNNRTLNEVATFVDTLLKNTLRNLVETKTLDDTITKHTNKNLVDVGVLVDEFSRVWLITRTFTEEIPVVDTLIKSESRNLIEEATLVDTKIVSSGKNLQEEVPLVDTINKSTSRQLQDTSTLVDVFSGGFSKILEDALTFVDTIVQSVSKQLTESLVLVDSLLKSTTRILGEVATLVDTLIRSVARSLAETVSYIQDFITDLVTNNFSATLTENLSLSDTLTFIWDRASNFTKKIISLLSVSKPVGGVKDKDNPTGFLNQPKVTGGVSAKDKPIGLLNSTDKPRMV